MDTEATRDKALDQYRVLMDYLRYENAIYWGRANFFLLANAALLAFALNHLPGLAGPVVRSDAMAAALVSPVGLVLALLWERALQAGEFWISHWHYHITKLEARAFGRRHLLRDFDAKAEELPRRVRARYVARQTVYVFAFFWFLLAVYTVFALMRG